MQTKDEKIPAPAMVAAQLNNQAGQMLDTYLDQPMKNLFRNHCIQDHAGLFWMSIGHINQRQKISEYRFLHIPHSLCFCRASKRVPEAQLPWFILIRPSRHLKILYSLCSLVMHLRILWTELRLLHAFCIVLHSLFVSLTKKTFL